MKITDKRVTAKAASKNISRMLGDEKKRERNKDKVVGKPNNTKKPTSKTLKLLSKPAKTLKGKARSKARPGENLKANENPKDKLPKKTRFLQKAKALDKDKVLDKIKVQPANEPVTKGKVKLTATAKLLNRPKLTPNFKDKPKVNQSDANLKSQPVLDKLVKKVKARTRDKSNAEPKKKLKENEGKRQRSTFRPKSPPKDASKGKAGVAGKVGVAETTGDSSKTDNNSRDNKGPKSTNSEKASKAYMICEECSQLIFQYQTASGSKNPTCQCRPDATYGCFWQEFDPSSPDVDTFACYRVGNETFWGRTRTKKGTTSTAELTIAFPTGGRMHFAPAPRA